MATVTKIGKQILRRIERLPGEDLPMVDSYLKKLEIRSTKKIKFTRMPGHGMTWMKIFSGNSLKI